jgi:hypothetical protein
MNPADELVELQAVIEVATAKLESFRKSRSLQTVSLDLTTSGPKIWLHDGKAVGFSSSANIEQAFVSLKMKGASR